MSMIVPQAWTRMMSNVQTASVSQDGMRNPAATRQMRDAATVEYSRAADAIVADLISLRGDGTLGRVTLFLSKKERG